jgi:hypothetical protein
MMHGHKESRTGLLSPISPGFSSFGPFLMMWLHDAGSVNLKDKKYEAQPFYFPSSIFPPSAL